MKYADAPTVTKSMRVAIDDLGLRRLFVAYPGAKRYSVDRRIEVLPLSELLSEIEALRRSERTRRRAHE